MMRKKTFALAAAFVALAAQFPLPQAALGQAAAPRDPEATIVSDLVVVAPTGGPAWWKVSKGDSTVWILGLPPAPTPQGLKWDRTTLERRLKGARLLIAPTTDWSGFPDGPRVLPVLAPPVARKVEAAAALLNDPFNTDEQASVASVVFLRTAYYRFYRLSHDVSPVVEAAAKRARVPVLAPPQNRYYWTAGDVDPRDPRMAGCIDGILKDVVVDPARYVQAGEAWARGDVSALLATAPRGAGWVCQHLFPGQWERAVDFHTRAIEDALRTPGKTLAALHIPQLVAEDGILDRLRKAGYTVSDPSRPLTE
jgi:hypothetical protein